MVKDFKLQYFVWLEFIIWLLIFCFVVGGIKIYQYHKAKELKTYQIFMPDVDGMIVGSPVKFMGVQVGYVQKIHIVNNTVYVKFVITDKETSLPQGSVATVEFNGLGGSKSLEITPPTKETLASKQFIIINQPKRLHDSQTLLNEMFDKLGAITARSSFFINQFANESKNVDINTETFGNDLKNINTLLDNIEKNNQNFKNKLKEWKR